VARQLINIDIKQFLSTSSITFLVTSHSPQKMQGYWIANVARAQDEFSWMGWNFLKRNKFEGWSFCPI